MARNEFYVQCLLSKPVKGGKIIMVSWIPSDKAQKGSLASLKEWSSDRDWTGPWEVVETFSKAKGDRVEAGENDYKNQRRMSDV